MRLRLGDALFFEPPTATLWGKLKHFASWRIQVHGGSRFSHVALYIGNGEGIEAGIHGVGYLDLRNELETYDGTIFAGRPVWPDSRGPADAVEWACRQIGTRYGFEDLLGCLAWDLSGWYPFPATHALICSELVGLALAEGRFIIPPENGVVWTPKDIAAAMVLTGRLRHDNGGFDA